MSVPWEMWVRIAVTAEIHAWFGHGYRIELTVTTDELCYRIRHRRLIPYRWQNVANYPRLIEWFEHEWALLSDPLGEYP